ncbi:serine hydrolase domain-containing protein [Arthrobacter sp. TMN-37]
MSSPETLPYALPAGAEGSLREELLRILTEEVAADAAPSAVAAVDVGGRTTGPVAVGNAVAFGDAGAALPPGDCVPARAETLYDLASVSKIVSTVALLALVADGVLDLDEPAGRHLPSFRHGPRAEVTLRHLLTHTSGLPGTWEGWRTLPAATDRADRLGDLLAVPLEAEPGTGFTYSCVGFNTAMALAERASGRGWADLVEAKVLAPLRSLDPRTAPLTYTPRREDCAATEYQPGTGRGMVRGEVHDESAWFLGGAVANAGLFGTAEAVLGLGNVLRDRPEALLPPALADGLWNDQLPRMLGPQRAAHPDPGWHALGLRIGQPDWMGTHAAAARGHNGFTGTSLVMDRTRSVTVVLLANRVHPDRLTNAMGPFRVRVADAAYATTEGKATA